MKKQIIEYTSPIDALVALVRQLNTYEAQYKVDSADFFDQYNRGETNDDEVFVEWVGNYQHYLTIRQELEATLKNVVTL